ncbi:5786_t:CDS:2 [Acaulospora colombiana]|uniref:5786_t:CDS:1 n=1 Tax=Acaulospora colombiana TaxID=27376 RepID=A0ACA9KSN9_9GLOM|nr:5786_t:CDS:2 [Acaulospora colombiana]
MGNTQSNAPIESNESDTKIFSETPKDNPIIPVAGGRPIKNPFHDFGSNSPFVGSPLLSHEEYRKTGGFEDMYEYIQSDDLASSYDTLADDGGPSETRPSSSIIAEPPYRNSNKIVYDSSLSGRLTPLTSANKQGTHKLKFIVDDEWKCSSDLSTATDPDGNLINYLEVHEDDYETINREGLDSNGFLPSTPPGDYTDEVPSYILDYAKSLDAEGDASAMSNSDTEDQNEPSERVTKDQPPTLPPHLERVLLNSPVISKDDNSVLPEPNHVVLNHLYACSIRDGVMAVAGTTRYRKKVSYMISHI